MATTVKTKKPSGLTLKRDNNTYTASWKIADKDYGDGQGMQVSRGDGWEKISVTATTKKKAFSVSKSDFYPNTKTVKGKTTNKPKRKQVSFRVRGNRKEYTKDRKKINPEMSDWATKTVKIQKPPKPKITNSQGTWPQTTFSVSVAAKDTDLKPYTRTQYQSVLKKDSNVSKGKEIAWSSTVAGSTRYDSTNANKTFSVSITEDSGMLADGHSYTRWFRARSQGMAGDSDWVYSKYVYADPEEATITDYTVTPASNKYSVKVWFDSPKSTARPISTIDTEWSIAIPDEDMECPAGASWTVGATSLAKDTSGGVSFEIGQTLTDDDCLFLRVNVKYADQTTYGQPVMALAGKLASPDITSVTTDPAQFTATIVAENNSSVQDSFLVVRYYDTENVDGFDVAIIEHGQTTATGIQLPEWTSTPRFGVYAAVGSYETITREDGVDVYAVEADMISDVVAQGGTIPEAPANVSASQTRIQGTIRVVWDWSWEDANTAELSWADHEDAWESTDEPQTYQVTKLHAAAWNISGLETGKTWYVRVRLLNITGDNTSYGAYSDTVAVDLSSAPLVPVLTLSEGVITAEGEVTASWVFSTTDGTGQAFAEIAEVTYEDGEPVYTTLTEVETAQHVTINAEEAGWTTGNSYALAVRVVSASGRASDGWSDPVDILIATPPTCTISDTSLTTVTQSTTDEDGQTVTETITALDEMPLTVTVTGAGYSDITRVVIERADSYHVDRPDETDFNGFEGETIAIDEHTGDAPFAFENDDLIGRLDDGASYRIIATVQDELGQVATSELEFEVVWSHQAEEPTATVTIDTENLAAILTPVAPAGAALTDVCDIYRLSADRPQLIYQGAIFGETYVDPYPAIGELGGHRFVTRTANDDYITADNQFAWYDTGADQGDVIHTRYNLIDFGDGQARLVYNADISNSWRKEFKETKYLGGSIQGDWNKAVSRNTSVSATAVSNIDQDLIETMRRLADYTGICHVRTKDGSSFPADVQVNETYNYASGVKTNEYSLTITRIDPEELDGLTISEWEALHEESE